MKIKEFMKSYCVGLVLGGILTGIVIVYAQTYFPSNDVTYDNKESGLKSENVQDAIDELYGICTVEPPAGETIIENAGLEKDPYECRYFFTGANPNNYITFNGENAGWRIISIECDGRIKIIKNNSIGNISWDAYDEIMTNIWSSSTLSTYLNNDYYNTLENNAKEQIILSEWGAGKVAYYNSNLEEQIKNYENSTKWNGKIALISASEYIRTNSDKTNCGNFKLMDSNRSSCKSKNWLYTNSNYWTISPTTTGLSLPAVFAVVTAGYLSENAVVNNNAVRPTLYLSSDIKITGGTGTQSDPYEISL